MSERLVKAKLFSLDDKKYDIVFMYNPTLVDFKRSIKLNQPAGARNKQGQNKISFANPEPCVITLSKILFDTYEEGTDVYKTYIEKMMQSVMFINPESKKDEDKRPPIYLFIWGEKDYLRCFVESFTYQLTMFLPNGMPVRAVANLTLKEVDKPRSLSNPRTPTDVDRYGDSRAARGG